MASAPVGRPELTVGVALMVSVSVYPLARSSRVTTVGPVGRSVVESQPELSGRELRDGITGPAQRAVGCEYEMLVGRFRKLFRPCVDFAGQRLERRSLQRLRFRPRFGGIGSEHEPVQTADDMALDDDFAGLSNFRIEHRVFP